MKKEDFSFIKKLIIIALPIIIQQFFLNIASLLDTMMVGKLDQQSVSGVYIATQIVFVINLMIFGATEGGSVFFSQFFGINDKKNMNRCFSFKLLLTTIVGIISMVITLLFSKELVSLFTKDSDEILIATKYLKIVTISFIPYGIASSITTTLREYHKATTSMIVTAFGALLNFLINLFLIFGFLGLPKLGAIGAAIGTVSERFFEIIVLIIIILVKKYGFIDSIKNSFKMDKELFKKLLTRSIPLIFNEVLWAFGQTVIIYIFKENDQIATVALPIASTIYNLLYCVCLGLGQSATILIGNSLGENKNDEAQHRAFLSIIFGLVTGILLGIILAILAPIISSSYTGLNEETRRLGMMLIFVYSVYIVLCSCTLCFFYIIRTGGKTLIVFLFDSCYSWLVQIPLAFLFLKVTNLNLIWFVSLVYAIDIIKIISGIVLITSRKWIKNLTNKEVVLE